MNHHPHTHLSYKLKTEQTTMAYKGLDSITASEIEAVGLPPDVAERFYKTLAEIVRDFGAGTPETWKRISGQLLSPDLPFALHQMMYYGCYKDFGPDPPAWIPDPESAFSTNIGKLLQRRGKEFLGSKYNDPMSSFSDFQEFSVTNPEVFWRAIFDEMSLSFSVPPQCILRESSSHPGGQWLPGAYLNPAKNCLSLNRKRTLDDTVVVWRDEGDDDTPVKKMTLKELRSEVWLVAHALDTLGLKKGSAIAIDMPMDVNSVVIYLAIVLAGYVVVSIADSFVANEIATRIRISKAVAIFTQELIARGDKRLPLYSRVVEAKSPLAIVIPTRHSKVRPKLRDGDIGWTEFLSKVENLGGVQYAAVEQPVEAFTNILFSSGTTGEPKAIPWTILSPLKAAVDGWCHGDIHKGDVVAWPTNLGWMMGPWLIYASLLNGASIALFNGSPLGTGFAKFVQDAKVTMLGVIPSIVRVWKSTNSTSHYDWSAIKQFGSTGEASNIDEHLWLMGRARYKPVIEYCGGTEIGGGFICGSLLQPQSLSAFSTPAFGCSLFIIGENGIQPSHVPGIGELALGPLMLGASSTLLNADHYNVYFKGMPVWNGKTLRRHGDVFERTLRGYYRAHGRADDTMNLGGIKVSSVEIERVCTSVDSSILETAAVGVSPAGGGPEMLVIAVIFKDSSNSAATDLNKLKASFNSALQKRLNPLFKVSRVVPLTSLPRTATNKVMRRVLRQQFSETIDRRKSKL